MPFDPANPQWTVDASRVLAVLTNACETIVPQLMRLEQQPGSATVWEVLNLGLDLEESEVARKARHWMWFFGNQPPPIFLDPLYEYMRFAIARRLYFFSRQLNEGLRACANRPVETFDALFNEEVRKELRLPRGEELTQEEFERTLSTGDFGTNAESHVDGDLWGWLRFQEKAPPNMSPNERQIIFDRVLGSLEQRFITTDGHLARAKRPQSDISTDFWALSYLYRNISQVPTPAVSLDKLWEFLQVLLGRSHGLNTDRVWYDGPDTTHIVGDSTEEIYSKLRTTAYALKNLVDLYQCVHAVDPGRAEVVFHALDRAAVWLAGQSPKKSPKPTMYFVGVMMEVWVHYYLVLLNGEKIALQNQMCGIITNEKERKANPGAVSRVIQRARQSELYKAVEAFQVLIVGIAAVGGSIITILALWGRLSSPGPDMEGWVLFADRPHDGAVLSHQNMRIAGRASQKDECPHPGDVIKASCRLPIILLGYGTEHRLDSLNVSPTTRDTLSSADSTHLYLEANLPVEVAFVAYKDRGEFEEVWVRFAGRGEKGE
jgi:hypothetical protein